MFTSWTVIACIAPGRIVACLLMLLRIVFRGRASAMALASRPEGFCFRSLSGYHWLIRVRHRSRERALAPTWLSQGSASHPDTKLPRRVSFTLLGLVTVAVAIVAPDRKST